MNIPLYTKLRAGLAAALLGFTSSTPTVSQATGKAGIHPWLEEGDRVQADVLIDGQQVAQLRYVAESRGMQRQPAVVFDLPPGLKRVRLNGQLIAADGKQHSFNRTWQVVDIASVSAPLYDHRLRWLDRIRGLLANTGDQIRIDPYEQDEHAAAERALAALEKRLGVTLPAPLWQLAQARISLHGYSHFVEPTEMRTVTEVLYEWGHPKTGEDALEKVLSPSVRARYDRSVLVFVDVGDGHGALAWDPTGDLRDAYPAMDNNTGKARSEEPGAGVWFWIQPDEIVCPYLLLDDAGRPRGTEAALTNVFQRFVLDPSDDIDDENELAVDTAHPRNLLQLHFEDNKRPKLWLRSYDYEYSLY